MARKLNLNIADKYPAPSWDPEIALAEAISEKNRFLEKNPHVKAYQAEIDALLDKAGNPQNRMAVLAMLMEGKLIELSENLKSLNRILVRVAENQDSAFRV